MWQAITFPRRASSTGCGFQQPSATTRATPPDPGPQRGTRVGVEEGCPARKMSANFGLGTLKSFVRQGGWRWLTSRNARIPPANAWWRRTVRTGNIAANTARRRGSRRSSGATASTRPAAENGALRLAFHPEPASLHRAQGIFIRDIEQGPDTFRYVSHLTDGGPPVVLYGADARVFGSQLFQ
jgi:hypothetical protein